MNNSNKKITIKKACSIALNIVFYSAIIILLLFSISNLSNEELKIPSFIGTSYLTVQTNSMAGNESDSFTSEDLLIVEKITEKKKQQQLDSLKVGDIITYKMFLPLDKIYILNTHRIVDIVTNTDNSIYIITQGDGNVLGDKSIYKYDRSKDDNDAAYYEIVAFADVRAIYKKHVDGLGKTMKFLQSSTGFFICIVMPTAALFLVQAFILAVNFFKLRQEKVGVAQKTDLESERERMKAEILAELQNQNQKKENEDNPS